ncbi:MAG: DUF484 family protein [Alcanivorax sp.]|uniref:DUF484 family protein n=1 Tax=Alloalcanivorax marinus TaxID=1177169 RepID=A0A9Q3UMU5_9GAMM|nr:DUF484 family protein [Alloalcanivorax marinus]MBM7335516.1 DUF484 family protein [Alloalcanivorax marinus]MCC4308891.1 DUF484 family protein [Alloalcanivorax marinus]MCU5787255.1 hypothetical protein [Alloalcanivorax marinus]
MTDDTQPGATLPGADQVAAFLRRHPEFFQDRPDLLELMRLPDPRGPAVSLLERQASILRDRNQELRERLNGLIDVARENDLLFEHTRRLTLALLEARNTDKLLRQLLQGLEQEFRCDTVSLLLHDREAKLLGEVRKQVRFVDPEDLPAALGPLLRTGKAVCGVLRQEELAALFQDRAEAVKSAAVVPLEHNGRLGVLAIGSGDAMHFRSSLGTLFISHIGQVLSRRLVEVSGPAANRHAQRA